MSNGVVLKNTNFLTSDVLKESEKKGKILYNRNENYKAIANLMEHPEFREFYNKHFTDWYDVKTIVMFLKLYEEIEKRSSVPLNGYQKLHILDKIINTSELRSIICQNVEKSEKANDAIELS